MQELLLEIEQFCRRHDMSETRFGELALNDKPFVSQLRAGRDLRGSTGARLREFMAQYEQGQPASAANSDRFPAGRLAFPHRGLTGIGQLERHEILYLLAQAEQWVELNRQSAKHAGLLAGLTIINAFFENSTRTLLSFEIAGKRLGADVVNMHAAHLQCEEG